MTCACGCGYGWPECVGEGDLDICGCEFPARVGVGVADLHVKV